MIKIDHKNIIPSDTGTCFFHKTKDCPGLHARLFTHRNSGEKGTCVFHAKCIGIKTKCPSCHVPLNTRSIKKYESPFAKDWTEVDFMHASQYHLIACINGLDSAKMRAARSICEGSGNKKELGQLKKYFKSKADKGIPQAQNFYALLLYQTTTDLASALLYSEKAAENGDPYGAFNCARMLVKTKKKEDLVKARALYKQAGDAGLTRGMFYYARMAIDGFGGDFEVNEAVRYFNLAADCGNLRAKAAIRDLALFQQKAYDEIGENLLKGLAKQSAEDAYNYALYCQEAGDVKSLAEALTYFEKAAEQGHLKSQIECGKFYFEMADCDKAIGYLEKAMSQGSTEAEFLYYSTICKLGGEENLTKARAFFEKTLEDKTHPKCLSARVNYAGMLHDGKGGPKDLIEAREHYRIAAEGENDLAQCNYALMLMQGKGGKQDLATARQFFKKSADQGISEAQFQYAMMAMGGEGGRKEASEGMMYLNCAAILGHESAKTILNEIRAMQNQKKPISK